MKRVLYTILFLTFGATSQMGFGAQSIATVSAMTTQAAAKATAWVKYAERCIDATVQTAKNIVNHPTTITLAQSSYQLAVGLCSLGFSFAKVICAGIPVVLVSTLDGTVRIVELYGYASQDPVKLGTMLVLSGFTVYGVYQIIDYINLAYFSGYKWILVKNDQFTPGFVIKQSGTLVGQPVRLPL